MYRTVRPKRKRRFEEFSLRYPLFVVFNSHSKYYSSLFLRTSLEDLFFRIPQGGVFERSHRVVQGDFGGGERKSVFSSLYTFIPTRGGEENNPKKSSFPLLPGSFSRFVVSTFKGSLAWAASVGGGGRPKQVEV